MEKQNWIEIYHNFRSYVKNKELDYSQWHDKFRTAQMTYFKEVEKCLKIARNMCGSDDDFCNRVTMNGFEQQEVCIFDGKIFFTGKQFFIGTGYYWNVSYSDELRKIINDRSTSN